MQACITGLRACPGRDSSLYYGLLPRPLRSTSSKVTICQIRSAIASAAILAILSLTSAVASAASPAIVEALKANPDAMSAVMSARTNGSTFCTLGSQADGTAFADNDRIAMLYAPAFRAWHGRGEVTKYTVLGSSIKGLYGSLQDGACNVIVETAPNILAILDEVDIDGLLVLVLPTPLKPAELAEAYARSLGYTSHAELLLAGHMMANSEELQVYYKLGITSEAAYDEALARMRSEEYSQDPLQLLAFLKDEAEGARRNLPAATIREERKSSGS